MFCVFFTGSAEPPSEVVVSYSSDATLKTLPGTTSYFCSAFIIYVSCYIQIMLHLVLEN
jgi:hypothetical protein